MPYFKKRALVVEAVQLERTVTLTDGRGSRVIGEPGDWLVKGRHAEYIVPKEQFDELYEDGYPIPGVDL
jgi:hypothetical protein